MASKDQFKEERDKIVKGLEEAYRLLIEFKKQKHSPLIVSRNGVIKAIDPNDASPTVSYKRGSKRNV